MDQSFLKVLLKKYREGRATKDEIAFLTTYYDAFELMAEESDLSNENRLQSERGFQIKQSIDAAIHHHEKKLPLRRIWLNYTMVAALLLVAAGFGIYAWLNFQADKQNVSIVKSSGQPTDIAPGTNKAVLVLADGSTVLLDDADKGELSKQAGVRISKTGDGQVLYQQEKEQEFLNAALVYNTISTPKAGQYRLTLSDGTRVWLNAATSLQYPANFSGKERRVKLTGEAYFEVAPDASSPFLVETAQQTVKVLGTHFNINAYDNENLIKTTLLEGKVQVLAAGSSGILLPGQQATNSSRQQLSITEADTEEAVAWKNGYFKFNKADIRSIMRQIERWYDVEVEYEGAVPDDLFVGKINRSEHISGVLRILELSKVQFNLVNRKIIVGKK